MASDVNYISPQGLLPKQGYEPKGFLGGMQYDQQMTDYKDMMSLQKLMSEMNAQKEQEELVQGAPVRQSKRLADVATNTSTAQTAIPTGQANLGLLQDKADISRAGKPDAIVQAHAEHIGKMGELGTQQLNRDIQTAQTIGAIMKANGPAGASMAAQQAEQYGYKPNDPFIQAIIQNPEAVTQHLLAVNGTHQAALAKDAADNKAKRESAESVARIQGDNAARAAKILADSRVDVAGMKGPGALSTDKQFAAYGQQIMEYEMAGQPIPTALANAYKTLQRQRIAERAAGVQQQQAGSGAYTGVQTPAVEPPANPALANQGDVAVKAQAMQAWGEYNPTKYVYGINPKTGKFARAPIKGTQ